jgi:hypothetical protein
MVTIILHIFKDVPHEAQVMINDVLGSIKAQAWAIVGERPIENCADSVHGLLTRFVLTSPKFFVFAKSSTRQVQTLRCHQSAWQLNRDSRPQALAASFVAFRNGAK